MKYGKTPQFRQVIRDVAHKARFVGVDEQGQPMYQDVALPTIKFTGTVKLHGCFNFRSKVLMWDGSTKKISKIKPGDIIVGYKNNAPVASKVINTFENGTTDQWLKITVNSGQMGGKRVLRCTPNHEIFVNGQWTPAYEIKSGDVVTFVKRDKELHKDQKSFIIGKLLGDGSVAWPNKTGNAGIAFSHKKNHEEYLDYCLKWATNFTTNTKNMAISGHGTEMVRAKISNCISVTSMVKDWMSEDGDRTVPEDLELDRISLAFWYMDDGSLGHSEFQKDRALFAICRYNSKEAETIKRALINYGFEKPVLYQADGYNRIRLNTKDAYKLFNDIKDLVPVCMQYKLPEGLRSGVEPTVPEFKEQFKMLETSSVVKHIEIDMANEINGREKYDIETETGNYFVSNILVHNSNAGIWNDRGRITPLSRRNMLSIKNDNFGFAAYVFRNLDFWQDYIQEGDAVFGEWAGKGIQRGVAISNIEPSFFMFEKRWATGEKILPTFPPELYANINLYSIGGFWSKELEIDFNNPELVQNQLIEITENIEKKCPVAEWFGYKGLGEGAVWVGEFEQEVFKFKVKGEKHSVSNVKTLANVDPEKIGSIVEFVDMAVTENRVRQAVQEVGAEGKEHTADVLRWVANDIIAEEADTLLANNLEWKDVAKKATNKARQLFFKLIC